MLAELDATVAALEWRIGAPDGEPEPLEAGITNPNFRPRVGGRRRRG